MKKIYVLSLLSILLTSCKKVVVPGSEVVKDAITGPLQPYGSPVMNDTVPDILAERIFSSYYFDSLNTEYFKRGLGSIGLWMVKDGSIADSVLHVQLIYDSPNQIIVVKDLFHFERSGKIFEKDHLADTLVYLKGL